jgi:hypothetical protein
VNGILAAGSTGAARPYLDLFDYNAADDAALTLAVSPSPPIRSPRPSPAPPVATTIASISPPWLPREIDWLYVLGILRPDRRRCGPPAAHREDAETQSQLLSQARSLRDEISGVDLTPRPLPDSGPAVLPGCHAVHHGCQPADGHPVFDSTQMTPGARPGDNV